MRFAPSRRLPPTLAALAVALAVGLPAPACALRGGPGGHARGHAADRGSARRAGRSAAGALAARPYMGWDTYFAFGGAYSEATVLRQASEMISLGLRGKPGWLAMPSAGGVEPPCATSSPGTFNGESQNASHRI